MAIFSNNLLKFILLFFCINLFSSELIIKDKNFELKDSYTYSSYLINANKKKLSPEKILTSKELQPLNRSSFGYFPHPIWTKLILINKTKQNLKFIFKNRRAGVNKIDVYIFHQNRVDIHKLGDLREIEDREIEYGYSTFLLKLKPNEKVNIITRIENKGALEVNWEILSIKNFTKISIIELIFSSIFLGLILGLIIYNLMIFFSLKKYYFLIYSLHAIFASYYQLALSGFWYQLNLIPLFILDYSTWLIPPLSAVTFFLFPILFFYMKKNMPLLYKLMIIYIISSLSLIIIYAIFYFSENLYIIAQISSFIFLFTILSLFLIGFCALKKRLFGAIFYILGQSSLILFTLYQVATMAGLFKINFISMYAGQIGLLLDMLFLSLALGEKIKYINMQNNLNEKLILSQSRFASIGQVVGNISHQWKVPLVHLGSLLMRLEVDVSNKNSNLRKEVSNIIPKMNKSIEFMSETIDEFYKFYSSENKQIEFKPKDEILRVLELLSGKSISLSANIELSLEDITIKGHKNSFSHIVMILIDNALDIAKKRKISNLNLNISLYEKEKKLYFKVLDNCGGVKILPINKIFELFISEKKDENSGFGLYIAKTLVTTKLNGEINVENTQNGALFDIVINI